MTSEMTLKAAISPPTTRNAISRLAATVLRANQSIIGIPGGGRRWGRAAQCGTSQYILAFRNRAFPGTAEAGAATMSSRPQHAE